MKWSYGVTTVPSRNSLGLPTTLASLKTAGFAEPWLFVDGCSNAMAVEYERRYKLPVTAHSPAIRTAGHWCLSIVELYLRNPHCDAYAIFQDDILCCKNLRKYLDRCKIPERGYWNLYTAEDNYLHITGKGDGRRHGWHLSNQLGKGALALVFSKHCFLTLFQQRHMIERPQCPHRGWQAIDGGISQSLEQIGYKEWVHIPSLVQHQGIPSAMGNAPNKHSPVFAGEDYDALRLLS